MHSWEWGLRIYVQQRSVDIKPSFRRAIAKGTGLIRMIARGSSREYVFLLAGSGVGQAHRWRVWFTFLDED